jgi:hypothetical protein
MNVARATQDLLDLVEADRRTKCAAIEDDARARRAALLGEAHAAARELMRAAFAEERERMNALIAAAQAMLATKRRLADQRRATALLAAGWERLPAALVDAWRNPASRRAWVAGIAAQASAHLPPGHWKVDHAPDWPADERGALVESLKASGAVPQLVADPGMRAGLRIAAFGNVLDGSLAGLVADRTEIGAMLLCEFAARSAHE